MLRAPQPEAVAEVQIGAGDEPPLHVHRNEEEVVLVLEGIVTFLVGYDVVAAAPGDVVVVPRGSAHTYWLASPTARFLRSAAALGVETADGRRVGPPPAPPLPETLHPAFDVAGTAILGPNPGSRPIESPYGSSIMKG